MTATLGIDTGGTFTDLVAFDLETGEIDTLKTSSTPDARRARRSSNALDEGDDRRSRRRDVHARHDRRHERADRAHRLPGRVPDDGRVRGHAVHPADQPQGALRPALDASPSRSSASRRLCLGVDERLIADGTELRAGRRGARCARSAGALRELGRRGRRDLPALLLRQHRARGARCKAIVDRGAARPAGLGLARGRADLARVRARLDARSPTPT